ncbi:unnamed protein product [Echinostoma caproni]|uniref:HRDC domain-containing protein n=1 Tax=Echinostoma caproni TaxID=27848 RepID=A0A183AUB0_9TREM|nr:unnamed protein product [Echinostoma caproni]
MLAEMEQARLNILCDDWNSVMLEEAERIPEQALDSIRTTVCKCRLVLQKKMPFFLSLVDMAEQSAKSVSSPSSQFKENQPPKTDVNDLAGYWALVADEIVQADAAFERLRVWRDEGQWEPSNRPVTPMRAPVKQTRRKSKAVKPSVNTTSKIPIKQTLVDRRINAGTLSVEITKALSEAVKSNKKPKVPVRSKLAEFLKSKRMVAADRNLRRRQNCTDVLTPLGLEPVSRRSRGTPKVLN